MMFRRRGDSSWSAVVVSGMGAAGMTLSSNLDGGSSGGAGRLVHPLLRVGVAGGPGYGRTCRHRAIDVTSWAQAVPVAVARSWACVADQPGPRWLRRRR